MTKDYERIYQGDGLYWGEGPSELVKRFAELAPQGKALDLGMGEGRDALYLASVGFETTGVESTDSGVIKCERIATQRKLSVNAICEDVRDYKIAKNRFALITAINLFQFMTKDEAEDVISHVVDGLKRGGLFVCSTFSQDDPSYKMRQQKSKEVSQGVFLDSSGNYYSLYHYGEMLRLCSELRPIYYAEYDLYDTQHGPPHWHGVVDIVGKKM
jgi:tellurite methyltransferase